MNEAEIDDDLSAGCGCLGLAVMILASLLIAKLVWIVFVFLWGLI